MQPISRIVHHRYVLLITIIYPSPNPNTKIGLHPTCLEYQSSLA